MKKLLNRTLRTFALYSLVVLAASIPAYYYLVDNIWLKELDEHNEIIANRIEIEFNSLQLTDAELAQSIALWNKVQPGTILKELADGDSTPDSVYTVVRVNRHVAHKDINRFRGLSKIIQIGGKHYQLTVETNVEETEETVVAIAFVTLLFFLILVAGFLFLNRRLSARLWRPFRSTLSKLKTFNLNNQTSIEFDKSDTLEFEELNEALRKLIAQNISVYRTQKEFTENASHELQTPLAIIKSKLDLLLQKETLTERQYRIIEEINKSLTRVTRINKNLLLLAKIENHQFDDNEPVPIGQLMVQCLAQFKEYAENKGISVQTEIAPDIMIEGNKSLLEILINNLLLNAIRHNQQNGLMTISLSQTGLAVSNSGSMALDSSAMFRRFAKTSNETAGTGIGLAIIKQICNRHGWAVNYQFEDNLHCFSIRF